MSTWTITDARTSKELGTIRNRLKLIGSKMVADGDFGRYDIKGHFGTHSYKITKNGHKVRRIDSDQGASCTILLVRLDGENREEEIPFT